MEAQFGYTAKVISPKGKIVYEYNPLYNYRKEKDEGVISDLITNKLQFDLEHPVNIEC